MFAASVGPQEPTGSSHSHPPGCTESLAAEQMPPKKAGETPSEAGPCQGEANGAMAPSQLSEGNIALLDTDSLGQTSPFSPKPTQ